MDHPLNLRLWRAREERVGLINMCKTLYLRAGLKRWFIYRVIHDKVETKLDGSIFFKPPIHQANWS